MPPKKAATVAKKTPAKKASAKKGTPKKGAAKKGVSRDANAYFKFGSYFKAILSHRFVGDNKKASSKEFVHIMNQLTLAMIQSFRWNLKMITMNSDRLTILDKDVHTLASAILTTPLFNAYKALYAQYMRLREKNDKSFTKEKSELLIIPTARVEKTLRGKNPSGSLSAMDEGDANLAAYLSAKSGKGAAKGFKVSELAVAACTCLVRVLVEELIARAGDFAGEEDKTTVKVRHVYNAVNTTPSLGLVFDEQTGMLAGAVVKEREDRVRASEERAAKRRSKEAAQKASGVVKEKKPRKKKAASKSKKASK